MKIEFERWKMVAADDRNFEVLEKREILNPKTKTTREDWVGIGYFGDLATAYKRMARACVESSLSDDLVVVLKRLDDLEKYISENIPAVKPKLEKSGKKGRQSSQEDFEVENFE